MEIVHKIDLLNDKKLSLKLNLSSLVLAILFGFVFWYLTTMINPMSQELINFEISSIWSAILYPLFYLLFYFLIMVIHELIHGAFFKLFSPEKKLKFGFKNSFAYAISPKAFYNKKQMLVIALAPFVLITLALILLYSFSLISRFIFILFATAHGAGCIGDFYYAYLLIRSPKNIVAQDKEDSFVIYKKESL